MYNRVIQGSTYSPLIMYLLFHLSFCLLDKEARRRAIIEQIRIISLLTHYPYLHAYLVLLASLFTPLVLKFKLRFFGEPSSCHCPLLPNVIFDDIVEQKCPFQCGWHGEVGDCTVGFTLMHRVHGSMCGNAHSSDLEPGARCGRAADQQAGGAATCVPQPQPQPLHDHTILIFHQSCTLSILSDLLQTQQEHRATALRQISSESGRSGALIPLNATKTTLALLKTLKVRAGDLALNKQRPQVAPAT
jgi:hypothetical protein